jgi:hypothetical protein
MILEAEKPVHADEFNPLLSAEARLDNAAERLGLDDGMRKVLRAPAREVTVNIPVGLDAALDCAWAGEGRDSLRSRCDAG